MHAAPAVQIAVPADWPWLAFVTAVSAAAAASSTGWITLHVGAGPGTAAVCAALAAVVTALTHGWRLRRNAEADGVLAWDGTQWTWQVAARDARAGDLQAMIDLGPWLLLRFSPTGQRGRLWWAVSRRQAGAAWPAFRAALFSRVPGHDGLSAPRL